MCLAETTPTTLPQGEHRPRGSPTSHVATVPVSESGVTLAQRTWRALPQGPLGTDGNAELQADRIIRVQSV